MLPIGSIFFPLRAVPMRIENNFQSIKLRHHQNYTTPIYQFLGSGFVSHFVMQYIVSFLVLHSP